MLHDSSLIIILTVYNNMLMLVIVQVDNYYSFLDGSNPFRFLLIEFHCTFSISYKKPTNYVWYIIVFWLGQFRPCGLLFLSCPLYFFPYWRLSSYLLPLFLYLISFLLFPCASVWENTRAWVPLFLLPYWMVLAFFQQCNYKCTMCIPGEKLEIVKHF